MKENRDINQLKKRLICTPLLDRRIFLFSLHVSQHNLIRLYAIKLFQVISKLYEPCKVSIFHFWLKKCPICLNITTNKIMTKTFSMNIIWKKRCVTDHLLLEWPIGLHIKSLKITIFESPNLCKVVLNAAMHIKVWHNVTFDDRDIVIIFIKMCPPEYPVYCNELWIYILILLSFNGAESHIQGVF